MRRHLTIAGLVALAAGAVLADEPPPAATTLASPSLSLSPSSDLTAAQIPDEWRVNVTLWLWPVGLDGTGAVRGNDVDIDAPFLDTLDNSDSLIGLAGRLEIAKGRWGGFLDGTYMQVGEEDAVSEQGELDIITKTAFVELAATYRVGDWLMNEAAPGDPERHLTLDLYGGVRYTYMSLDLDFDDVENASGNQSWIDPMIGAQVEAQFTRVVRAQLRGDVGGFSVGSDFAWSVAALVGFDFKIGDTPTTFYAGYRALGQDYSDGSGDERFEWDVITHGPLLGLTLRF